MQRNWLKTQIQQNPAILTAATQFVTYRVAQKSKLQFFSQIFTKYWNCFVKYKSVKFVK